MHKMILKVILFTICGLLSSYSKAYSNTYNNKEPQGYLGVSAVMSFQRVDSFHTRSTIDPAIFDVDEISKFNINRNVPGFSVVAGRKFLSFDSQRNDLSLRGELEYSWYKRHNTKKRPAFAPPTVIDNYIDVEMQAQRAMFNLYLNKQFVNKMNLYAGGGLGAAFINSKVQLYGDPDLFSDTNSIVNFAWSGIIGANYRIYKNLNLNLAYNYVDLGAMRYHKMNASPSSLPGVVILRKPASDALTAQNVSLGLYYYL